MIDLLRSLSNYHRLIGPAFIVVGLLGVVTGSAAQDAPLSAGSIQRERASAAQRCAGTTARELLRRSYNFQANNAEQTPVEISLAIYKTDLFKNKTEISDTTNVEPSVHRVLEGVPIVLRLVRPPSISEDDWKNSTIYGAGQTVDKDQKGEAERTLRIQMPVREKTGASLLIDATMPETGQLLLNKEWTIVPVLCGPSDTVLGYGSAAIVSVSNVGAWSIAGACILGFWLLISAAAWQLNRKKLDILWNNYRSSHNDMIVNAGDVVYKLIWKFFEVVNPVFISQDSLGFGSLARFQILVFTTVVGCVLMFVFVHSGILSNISNTVLTLLGVTVGGGTLARATGDWVGISAASRRLLTGAKILATQPDKPRWSDLFETQGELDVAKIQALLFTFLISISLFASGNAGLSAFTLPDQIVYLAIVSQGAYLFGKLIPAETRKSMEADLATLRLTARNILDKPENATPEQVRILDQAYLQARSAARVTLEQTYVERFKGDVFDAVTQDPANVL